MVVDLYMFFEINYNEYAERKEEEENYEKKSILHEVFINFNYQH
jgi:hypothetical protein